MQYQSSITLICAISRSRRLLLVVVVYSTDGRARLLCDRSCIRLWRDRVRSNPNLQFNPALCRYLQLPIAQQQRTTTNSDRAKLEEREDQERSIVPVPVRVHLSLSARRHPPVLCGVFNTSVFRNNLFVYTSQPTTRSSSSGVLFTQLSVRSE